jgi:hypothetical protein
VGDIGKPKERREYEPLTAPSVPEPVIEPIPEPIAEPIPEPEKVPA